MKAEEYIDSTLLLPNATKGDIEKLINEALWYQFHSVCINPTWVSLAKQMLNGSKIAVCTVVGFPLGATSIEAEAYEAKKAVLDGADEIDMVMNIGHALSGDWDYVKSGVEAVVQATNPETIVKVILEVCFLSDEQITKACEIAVQAGSDFVKTSTGFAKGGATVHSVEIMRKAVGPDFGVKAAGGIHTPEEFFAMITAGATRIGASNGASLVKGK